MDIEKQKELLRNWGFINKGDGYEWFRDPVHFNPYLIWDTNDQFGAYYHDGKLKIIRSFEEVVEIMKILIG